VRKLEPGKVKAVLDDLERFELREDSDWVLTFSLLGETGEHPS
jgi:hypothetical protein